MRIVLILAFAASSSFADLVDSAEHGIRIERGFRITQFSDERLANDIWCMALNPRNEVVVSGPGYIATLLDTDADGRADQRVEFTTLKGGAMGIAFDKSGKQALIMADGWLSEYVDDDLNRVADGPPRRILPFASGEHGGHAVRLGPDGWLWCIGGNNAGINEEHDQFTRLGDDLKQANRRRAGNARPVAGAIVRISPDLLRSEVMADGFRNPYDFDFNESGDVFTYDSDCERDYFLPWYSGCRVYHVQLNHSHGWRLAGHERSFRVPDYMPETVPALADLGRGSPTGVHVYRGRAFPPHFCGGIFAADWTFGRVWYLPLLVRATDAESAASRAYDTAPELFIEPIGTHGFAPTDIVETADGALLISIGGRKTRGSIFRIEATANTDVAPPAALVAPQSPASDALQRMAEIQGKLGGWKLAGASAEAFCPYEPSKPEGMAANERRDAAAAAQSGLNSFDSRVVAEAARVCAMLGDDSAVSAARILNEITPTSSPTGDFHFLACLARMTYERDAEFTAKTANAFIDLDRKLAGGDRRPKQMWPLRLNEVLARHIERDPALAAAVISKFKSAGHAALIDALPQDARDAAARHFLALASSPLGIEWSPDFIKAIAPLPDARPLLRARWKDIRLRATLRPLLQRDATPEDLVLLQSDAPVAPNTADATEFATSLADVAWEKGDAARGERIFRERACAGCHTGTSPIGPDLAGPVSRLSPAEFMVEVQFPSRNIADAFRSTVFTLKDATQRNAYVAFLSADGVIIQTGPGVTERLAETEIAAREPSAVSIMPPALLAGLQPADLADLYRFLRTLGK